MTDEIEQVDKKVGRIKWAKYDASIQGVRGIIESYDSADEELPFMIRQDASQFKYEEGRMVQYIKKEDGIIPKADNIDVI